MFSNELTPQQAALVVERLHADPRWPAWRRRFLAAARQVQNVKDEMRASDYPHANLYLHDGGLSLLVSASHTGHESRSVQEAVAVTASLGGNAGGGDW